jgi:hypothetical protein
MEEFSLSTERSKLIFREKVCLLASVSDFNRYLPGNILLSFAFFEFVPKNVFITLSHRALPGG